MYTLVELRIGLWSFVTTRLKVIFYFRCIANRRLLYIFKQHIYIFLCLQSNMYSIFSMLAEFSPALHCRYPSLFTAALTHSVIHTQLPDISYHSMQSPQSQLTKLPYQNILCAILRFSIRWTCHRILFVLITPVVLLPVNFIQCRM